MNGISKFYFNLYFQIKTVNLCSEISLSSTKKQIVIQHSQACSFIYYSLQSQARTKKINSRKNLEGMGDYLYHKAPSHNPLHILRYLKVQVDLQGYHLQDSPNNNIFQICLFCDPQFFEKRIEYIVCISNVFLSLP